MTFPAHQAQHPACLPPSLLVSAIVARPPHKPHCVPTTNEITQGLTGPQSCSQEVGGSNCAWTNDASLWRRHSTSSSAKVTIEAKATNKRRNLPAARQLGLRDIAEY